MNKTICTMSSTLPPAELKERLKWEAAIENRMYSKQLKTVWKWKSEYTFTVYCIVSETDSGAGGYWSIGRKSAFWNFAAGTSFTAYLSPIFCGEILPEGNGSIIRGCFRERLLVWMFCMGIYGILIASLIMAKDLLIRLILLYFLVRSLWVVRDLLYPDQLQSSAALWDIFEYIVKTAECPPAPPNLP